MIEIQLLVKWILPTVQYGFGISISLFIQLEAETGIC